MMRKQGVVITMVFACAVAAAAQSATNTFDSAVRFVDRHSQLVVLSAENGASIAVWPAMQGRVLTSSTSPDGRSFGWINDALIASGKVQPHIDAVGGEDRLWLGPEGGQYSLFFAPGAPYDLDHWYTPAAFDTEPFDVVGQTKSTIALRREVQLTNHSGTRFNVRIDREVRLLPDASLWRDLKLAPLADVKLVGFESINKLTNEAPEAMSKQTGVLSLWVLGQFRAAPAATIILPIRSGPESELGIPVKTDYFGAVPADRIQVDPDYVLFKADSNFRSKLGVSPRRARGAIGSFDPEHHLLTIVQFDGDPHADYVNSAWEQQKEPYQGDEANCYNDGVPSPGKPQLGHFYELESSSPAVALGPRASVSHTQRTIHLVGPDAELDRIAFAVLGVHLKDVLAFNRP